MTEAHAAQLSKGTPRPVKESRKTNFIWGILSLTVFVSLTTCLDRQSKVQELQNKRQEQSHRIGQLEGQLNQLHQSIERQGGLIVPDTEGNEALVFRPPAPPAPIAVQEPITVGVPGSPGPPGPPGEAPITTTTTTPPPPQSPPVTSPVPPPAVVERPGCKIIPDFICPFQ